jgi:tetratricopeptide (TPR) repeat protein
MQKVRLILASIISIGFVVAVGAFVKMYAADVAFTHSQALVSSGQITDALAEANKAVAENPLEPNYYRGRAKVELVETALVEHNDVLPIKVQMLADLRKAYELNPNNLVTLRNLMPLYYYLALKDLSRSDVTTAADNIDQNFFAVSKNFLETTKTRFPNDAGVWLLAARYEKKLGMSTEFEASRAHVRQLRPDLLDWNADLAN